MAKRILQVRGTQAINRAFDILDAVTLAPHGITVRDLAQVTGINVSTLYRLAATLEGRGYLYRLSGRVYAGPRISRTGYDFDSHVGAKLRSAAKPIAHHLARETSGTTAVSLHLGNSGYLLLLDDSIGPHFTAIEAGEIFPTQKGAIGRILLAYGHPAMQEQAWTVPPDQPGNPGSGITAEGLALTRRTGYTYSCDQVQSDTMGFFAPVLQGRRALGSVGTILTKTRLSQGQEQAFSAKVRDAAAELADVWRLIEVERATR